MAKKKSAETANTVAKQHRARSPKLPKGAIFMVSRNENEDSVTLRLSSDVTEEEFNALLAVLEDFVESYAEPQVVHIGYSPPPS